MNKTLWAALSLSSFLIADDRILLPHAKGIILTGDPTPLPLDVEGVAIVDLTLPGGAECLKERLIPLFMEKSLTVDDVNGIKREILRYYHDHGRYFVVVNVPEQDVTDGVLTLIVTEATLGEVTVSGNHYFSKELIRSYITQQAGAPIDNSVLVKNLYFINQNPFRHGDLVYGPGKNPGTTDVEVAMKDQLPLRAYLGTDNTGVEATGRLRLLTGFYWGKAFGKDQILSFQYTTSSDFHKFQGYTLSYNLLLPWQNTLLFYGGYSTTHVHLTSVNKTDKNDGKSGQISFRYGIPFKPKTPLLHEFTAGYDFKSSNNTFTFSDVSDIPKNQRPKDRTANLTQFVFEYNFGYQKEIQKIGFDGELFLSPFSWIPGQSKADFQASNPYAKPHYAYGKVALDYTLSLPANFLWNTFFEAQVATSSLLPSEQFGLGGYDTVRGYNERASNSDEGILLTTEVWSPPFSPSLGLLADHLQFLIFLDYGLAHDIHKISGIRQTDWLMGVGPGLRYSLGPHLTARLDVGFKLHREGFEGGIGMAHFSVTGSY